MKPTLRLTQTLISPNPSHLHPLRSSLRHRSTKGTGNKGSLIPDVDIYVDIYLILEQEPRYVLRHLHLLLRATRTVFTTEVIAQCCKRIRAEIR